MENNILEAQIEWLIKTIPRYLLIINVNNYITNKRCSFWETHLSYIYRLL